MCFAPQRRALFRHFFDIWTSKSGPNMVCFVHFDLEMCFAPQRRALFRHRNFQKWSDHGVLCAFWLQNVLRATTACAFSTSQLPKVVRSSSALSILTWKCASRHNGVRFFMSHLASWLRTRRFSEPTFRPSGATNHWKNTVGRDFPIFSRIYLFFLLIFSLLTLLTSAFQLSILSEVSLLNFLRLVIENVLGLSIYLCTLLILLLLLWCSRRLALKLNCDIHRRASWDGSPTSYRKARSRWSLERRLRPWAAPWLKHCTAWPLQCSLQHCSPVWYVYRLNRVYRRVSFLVSMYRGATLTNPGKGRLLYFICVHVIILRGLAMLGSSAGSDRWHWHGEVHSVPVWDPSAKGHSRPGAMTGCQMTLRSKSSWCK